MATSISRNRRLIVNIGFWFLFLIFFYSLHKSRDDQYFRASKRAQINGYPDKSAQPQIGRPSQRTVAFKTNDTGFMTLSEAQDFCSSLDMTVWPVREHRRKVYDLTLVNTELDWLEIRLNELWDEIDYFVMVEATRTFTNKPKKLFFQEELRRPDSRFHEFASKIIYHVLDIEVLRIDYAAFGTHKDREKFQRNANFEIFLPGLIGEQQPQQGDVLIISDIDELPKPHSVRALRNCDFGSVARFHARLSYYSFQYRQLNLDWMRPQAIVYTGDASNMMKPEELRASPLATKHLWDSAWHCSCCFGTVVEMVRKMGSFSHSHLDTEDNRRPENVVKRVREGLDVFGRDIIYERVAAAEMDYPEYLKANQERFSWMLERDGESAGFLDYQTLKEEGKHRVAMNVASDTSV